MTGEIKKGKIVWIPCEVNTGPFPDERRVYVDTEIDEWFGFVNVSELDKKVEVGKDRVRALVLDVRPEVIIVGINGQILKQNSSALSAPSTLIALATLTT